MGYSDPLVFAAIASRLNNWELGVLVHGLENSSELDDEQRALVDEARMRGVLKKTATAALSLTDSPTAKPSGAVHP